MKTLSFVVLLLCAVLAIPAGAAARCAVSDIRIVSIDASFVDVCRRRVCFHFKGAGRLRNTCAFPIGVELKITALDRRGAPVAVKQFWPASVENIAPGEFSFSLDEVLSFDSRIDRFTVVPVTVQRWEAM